jgi:hypothetical protein
MSRTRQVSSTRTAATAGVKQGSADIRLLALHATDEE